jgi:hypothetical protein
MARCILWGIVLISFGISAVGVVSNVELSFEFRVATLFSLGVLSLCEVIQPRKVKEEAKADEGTKEVH